MATPAPNDEPDRDRAADPHDAPGPIHPPGTGPAADDPPEPIDRALARVLQAMRTLGPRTADDLARLCLPLPHVVAAMPHDQRDRRVHDLLAGLITLLDDEADLGTETTLLAAVAQMRLAEHRTREGLVWADLPPVLRQAALRAARLVIDHALAHEWVTPTRTREGHPAWRITPTGGGELDRLDRAARA